MKISGMKFFVRVDQLQPLGHHAAKLVKVKLGRGREEHFIAYSHVDCKHVASWSPRECIPKYGYPDGCDSRASSSRTLAILAYFHTTKPAPWCENCAYPGQSAVPRAPPAGETDRVQELTGRRISRVFWPEIGYHPERLRLHKRGILQTSRGGVFGSTMWLPGETT